MNHVHFRSHVPPNPFQKLNDFLTDQIHPLARPNGRHAPFHQLTPRGVPQPQPPLDLIQSVQLSRRDHRIVLPPCHHRSFFLGRSPTVAAGSPPRELDRPAACRWEHQFPETRRPAANPTPQIVPQTLVSDIRRCLSTLRQKTATALYPYHTWQFALGSSFALWQLALPDSSSLLPISVSTVPHFLLVAIRLVKSFTRPIPFDFAVTVEHPIGKAFLRLLE